MNMVVYSVYIVSKSGGLIFNYDNNSPRVENEKTFSYPLEIKLTSSNKTIVVALGQGDAIKVGHTLLAVNGLPVTNGQTSDGRDVFEMLDNPKNYPINLKFGRAKMTTNDKIFLASMFYPLFALSCQLSPEQNSSGIQSLETDTFRLNCFQTLTGVKFIVIGDRAQMNVDMLLKKIYELYADYVMKNPFYSLEMPIRCELFDTHLVALLEQLEKFKTLNT